MQLNSLTEKNMQRYDPSICLHLVHSCTELQKKQTTSPKMEVFAYPYFLYIHCHTVLDHTRLRTT
jgi:hypothetical protein